MTDTLIIPPHSARARAMRLAAGDSMVALSRRLEIHTISIHQMERGDDGCEPTAMRVIGHYMGRANERTRSTPVGQRIRELRVAAGHSATALAALIGVKPGTIWAVEARPQDSRRTCRKIAAFYGVAASELEAA